MAEKLRIFFECRATFRFEPVLAKGNLNVMVPVMEDLADSLASTWKADICNCNGESGATQTNSGWTGSGGLSTAPIKKFPGR
jgi:hypothetical protein